MRISDWSSDVCSSDLTRATLNNQWSRGDWGVGYIARYIGANGEGASSTDSYLTHDLQASVELPWNAKFTLGVNNVTDKMPELIGYDGRPFNFYLYYAYGRTPYMRYVQRFCSFAPLQHWRGLPAPLFFPAILLPCRTPPPPPPNPQPH